MHQSSQNPSNTNKVIWEWTARIHSRKSECDSTYNVILFLGAVPKNPEEWLTSPNLVGKHSVLISSYRTGGRGLDVTEGFVHLDNGIVKHSGLNSLEPNEVVPYLTRELDWRVQKIDGSIAHLDTLEVVVFATPMTLPPGGMFPVPGRPHRYNSITYGRPGGSKEADDALE
ncbi:hypothetical protein BDN70DRAFT_810991 [Pholiota conissans]|uniref:Tyrosinase C-terminal domain-containing protein n=1 Tax=Pholiota conissans TaxID=109636 RepID=A0A9P6CRP5_9AGAR|nr:hypothetical protein BDN70DRAFT_810991 [Pholiota conissans]